MTEWLILQTFSNKKTYLFWKESIYPLPCLSFEINPHQFIILVLKEKWLDIIIDLEDKGFQVDIKHPAWAYYFNKLLKQER